jgi:PST family polysaccharide transporter
MNSGNQQPASVGIARSVRWTGVSKAVGQLATAATTLIIARWILREDFGLFALAIAYVSFVDIFIDLGFVAALIQRQNIDQNQLSSCFWLLCGTSATLFLVGETLAPALISGIFSDARLTLVIQIVSIAFLVVPTTVVCSGLLSRQLRFESLAKAEIASGLFRCLVTLGLAYRGFGVMSLVFGFLADRLLLSGLLFLVTGWRPSLVWRGDTIREIAAFGSQVLASRLLWYMYSKLDTLIIGRLLGLEVLGLYSMAAQLASAFYQFVSSAYYRIAFPVLSQLQFSPSLGTQFLKFSRYLTIVALPVFVGIAATSHDIVAVLLDPRWISIVTPLQVLAVVAAVQTMSGLLGQATNAVGKPRLSTMINLVSVPLFASGFYLGALMWGMNGVLGAWLVLMPIRFLVIAALTCRIVQVPLKEYVAANSGPFVAVMVMSGFVTATAMLLSDWSPLLRLLALVMVGSASYVGMSLLLYRESLLALLAMLRPQFMQAAR